MILFDRFELDNGLKVLVHTDNETPMAVLNVLYDVGARDEDCEHTGFAHLFEHLMFGGSINIPSYDEPLQEVGGENNAFTTNDITNYYLSIPSDFIETGFWLESDRMLDLAFTPKSLEVQKQVVCEEFRQRYLNQPYGDLMHLLRALAYKKHPYRWPTIGLDTKHIEEAKMDDVKAFYKKYYHPSNAILVLSGNVRTEQAKRLCDKWFAPIAAGKKCTRVLPVEPEQTEYRRQEVFGEVPLDMLVMAFKVPAIADDAYIAADVISDLLANGKSAPLYRELVVNRQLFTNIDAYITGACDPGLLIIQGNLIPGVTPEVAEAAVWDILGDVESLCSRDHLCRARNKEIANIGFTGIDVLGKAMQLAFYENLGDANRFNKLQDMYSAIKKDTVVAAFKQFISRDKASVLHYRKKS